MHPVLKALVAQLGGWGITLLLSRHDWIAAQLWPLAATQPVAAAAIAALLRSARWWLPIHLAFTPLLAAAHSLSIHPNWYLAAFVILTWVYWSSFRTQVPLFLSNRATVAAVAALLPEGRSVHLLDIGSGIGSLLIVLARNRPDCRFTGIECAPAPWLLSRLRGRKQANVEFLRGDFFKAPWSDYDLIYAFLSPAPMHKVWRKAQLEMRPDALLVSNSFTIPGMEPAKVIETGDRRTTKLYVYRPGQGASEE